MVGSINPFELFLVCVEVVDAIHDERSEIAEAAAVLHKIDIAFNIEDKIAAMIRSVVATQTAYAKALARRPRPPGASPRRRRCRRCPQHSPGRLRD
jgi:L-rhamnose isomerase